MPWIGSQLSDEPGSQAPGPEDARDVLMLGINGHLQARGPECGAAQVEFFLAGVRAQGLWAGGG